jgi:hypothetical protein
VPTDDDELHVSIWEIIGWIPRSMDEISGRWSLEAPQQALGLNTGHMKYFKLAGATELDNNNFCCGWCRNGQGAAFGD